MKGTDQFTDPNEGCSDYKVHFYKLCFPWLTGRRYYPKSMKGQRLKPYFLWGLLECHWILAVTLISPAPEPGDSVAKREGWPAPQSPSAQWPTAGGRHFTSTMRLYSGVREISHLWQWQLKHPAKWKIQKSLNKPIKPLQLTNLTGFKLLWKTRYFNSTLTPKESSFFPLHNFVNCQKSFTTWIPFHLQFFYFWPPSLHKLPLPGVQVQQAAMVTLASRLRGWTPPRLYFV